MRLLPDEMGSAESTGADRRFLQNGMFANMVKLSHLQIFFHAGAGGRSRADCANGDVAFPKQILAMKELRRE